MRDITLGDTVYFNFTTRAFSTGVPTQLAGSPALSVLESNNTTPITSGVSVNVDRASVTGLNQATVVATSGNGFEAGKSYCIYISTGTVGGTSAVGEVVAQFTIESEAAFTRLGAPVGASISADIANVPTTVWAYVVTGTTTAVQAMRGFIAAMLGKASGLPTAPKYRNIADTKNVIDATTDSDGNRTAVTLDLT